MPYHHAPSVALFLFVEGRQAYAVGLIAAGPARDDSKNQLPLPDTSLTSQLAQMLPSAVVDTLTLNEVGSDRDRRLSRKGSSDEVLMPAHSQVGLVVLY